MPRTRWTVLAVASFLATVSAHACTLSGGYFYQVTALKGQVVGTNFAHNFTIGLPRWFRESFARAHAKLTLYEYVSLPQLRNEMPFVKTVETDSEGKFDFGAIEVGHYTLIVDDATWGADDWFDVEVKEQTPITVSVTIDITPVKPDCSGGHQFTVKNR